jgi:hypothetical protein
MMGKPEVIPGKAGRPHIQKETYASGSPLITNLLLSSIKLSNESCLDIR